MRLIYFLNLSLCLFFNGAVFCSAELEKTDYTQFIWLSGWRGRDAQESNPLKQLRTYLDDSRKFTLAKAAELIDQETKKGKDLVNSPGTESKRSPLQWLVVRGFELNKIITPQDQLNMAQLLITKGANDESIKKAFLHCKAEIAPHRIEANASIKEFLCSVKTEKEIEIDEEEVDKLKKFKKGLWRARKANKRDRRVIPGVGIMRRNYYPPRRSLTLANVENGPPLLYKNLAPQARMILDQIRLNPFEIKNLIGEGLTLTEIKEMVEQEF